MKMILRFFYHLISFVVFCGGVFAFFCNCKDYLERKFVAGDFAVIDMCYRRIACNFLGAINVSIFRINATNS